MAIPETSYRNTQLWYGRNGGPYKQIDDLAYWEKEVISD
jgi:hypothetical protein